MGQFAPGNDQTASDGGRMNTGSGSYAVDWFTLSLINAGLAQAKGRSGLRWWLISLLIGPLATVLIVVWPRPEPKPPTPAPA
jgi:hypothetical protein